MYMEVFGCLGAALCEEDPLEPGEEVAAFTLSAETLTHVRINDGRGVCD